SFGAVRELGRGGAGGCGVAATAVMAVVCGASTGMSIVTSGGGTSTGGFSNSGGGGGGGSFSTLRSSTMSVWMGGAITSSARRASPVASAQAMNTCRAMMVTSTAPRRVMNWESCAWTAMSCYRDLTLDTPGTGERKLTSLS